MENASGPDGSSRSWIVWVGVPVAIYVVGVLAGFMVLLPLTILRGLLLTVTGRFEGVCCISCWRRSRC